MNYKVLKDDLIKWISDWFKRNQEDNLKAVLGVSGGVISTVTLAVCVEALGKENVIAIIMRDDKNKNLDNEAINVCKTFDVKYYCVPVFPAVNVTKNVINLDCKIKITEQAVKNLPARMRMTTLYTMSQCLNGRVVSTLNLSDAYIGNFTHFGDELGDLAPLALLTREEIVQLGCQFDKIKPYQLYLPADDKLPASKPDVERLGFTFQELDEYIRTGKIESIRSKSLIDKMFTKNRFKSDVVSINCFVPGLQIHCPN